MTKFRVYQAFSYAIGSGKNITRMDLANKRWPMATEGNKRAKISNLFTGKTKRLSVDEIVDICETFGVDANYLVNMKPMKGINNE